MQKSRFPFCFLGGSFWKYWKPIQVLSYFEPNFQKNLCFFFLGGGLFKNSEKLYFWDILKPNFEKYIYGFSFFLRVGGIFENDAKSWNLFPPQIEYRIYFWTFSKIDETKSFQWSIIFSKVILRLLNTFLILFSHFTRFSPPYGTKKSQGMQNWLFFGHFAL